MILKKILYISLGFLIAVAYFGFDPAKVLAKTNQRFVIIGSGGPKGVYSKVGDAICYFVNNANEQESNNSKITVIRCSAPKTGGSLFNLNQLYNRAFDFGLVQSDMQFQAYKGTAESTLRKNENIRSVFSIHMEPFRLVVDKGSKIKRFSDLKKKRVNIGSPGSGNRAIMEKLMQLHGFKASNFKSISEWTSTEDSTKLCRGKIDAYLTGVGIPNDAEANALINCEAQIIGLNGPVEEKLVRENPYYLFTTIPKESYDALNEDIATFGVTATLVTRADVDEDTVYRVVKAVMENFDDFRNKHSVLNQLTREQMIKAGLTAPLHPGAVRYYKEQKLM